MTPVSIAARADGVLDVFLRGEIDYTNATPVTRTVTEAVDRVRPSTVRVDLTEVTFLDSSGIGVLITGLKAARQVAAEYRVRGPNPKVLDQLRITGLIELFPVDGADPPAAGG
jgi:stage II sporulation protein AA (anti-sigma F factor antagonist)